MSLEADLKNLWGPLVGGRLFPLVIPLNAVRPCMVWQQVGGRAGWYVDKKLPSHKHARIQLFVWSDRFLEARSLARAAEKALCESPIIAEPYGALNDAHNEALNLYGTRQDFGVWYPDP